MRFEPAMLTVNEIFYSIQGESTRAGQPCVFVRLTACDLRCSWCDTPYAFHEGRKMSVDEVVAAVEALRLPAGRDHRRRAAAAGGRLPADGPAARRRPDRHARNRRPSADRRACRPRSSRSSTSSARAAAKSDKNDWTNLDRLAPHDEVKFVVQDRADYEFARDVIARHDLPSRVAAVLLSPVHGVLEPKTLSEWMLADRLPARLQLQLHKYIWSPTTRGV